MNEGWFTQEAEMSAAGPYSMSVPTKFGLDSLGIPTMMTVSGG